MYPPMPPRFTTISLYWTVFIWFALCPCTSLASTGGDKSEEARQKNTVVIVIIVISLVFALSLAASLVICFPSLLPTSIRRFWDRATLARWPRSPRAESKLKTRPLAAGHRSNETYTPPAHSTPSHSPTLSTSSTMRGREISSPLSILLECHSAAAGNEGSRISQGQDQNISTSAVESPGPETASGVSDGPAVMSTENTLTFPPATHRSQSMFAEEASDRQYHHPLSPAENTLPPTPTPSTRPPTYYTDASRASMTTLPLYQESDYIYSNRVSNARSISVARGRRSRKYPRGTLPTPPSSYPLKS